MKTAQGGLRRISGHVIFHPSLAQPYAQGAKAVGVSHPQEEPAGKVQLHPECHPAGLGDSPESFDIGGKFLGEVLVVEFQVEPGGSGNLGCEGEAKVHGAGYGNGKPGFFGPFECFLPGIVDLEGDGGECLPRQGQAESARGQENVAPAGVGARAGKGLFGVSLAVVLPAVEIDGGNAEVSRFPPISETLKAI